MRELYISKRDIRVARLADVAPPPLPAGQARLKLDLFSLTANNITYAAMGTGMLGYWDFFPGPEGWGRPPCWGFATVVESKADGVEVGARLYGYYPIGDILDVTPQKAGPRGFADGAPHRSAKAAVYNQYLNVVADPAYDSSFEPEQTLFRPLYATGWWAADCVTQGSPRAIFISSASSKTALSLAHQLSKHGDVEIVALTSPRNVAYVRETGLYGLTLTYDAVDTIAASDNAVYVDFLGRRDLTAAVHRALGPKLVRSIVIGATDWGDKPGGVQPPQQVVGPKPEFFFVPTYAADRLNARPDLGAAMLNDMRAFYAASRKFVTVRRAGGGEAILECWQQLAAGDAPPSEGLVLSL